MNPFRWLFTWLTRNRTRSNLYDLDHAVLNVQMPPSTMWMNMGYWKVGETRPRPRSNVCLNG